MNMKSVSEKTLYGSITVALLTGVAFWVGSRLPMLGSSVCGMILGILLRNTVRVGTQFGNTISFCTKRLLRIAIVLLGTTFTIREAIWVGREFALVILSTIVVALGVACLLGRLFKIPRPLASLIGYGTAICGVTAILTVGPLVRAKDEEIMYGITTVFLFNLIAMVVCPLIAHSVAMNQTVFGAWVGTAVHDTSSVLATAFAYSDEAGQVATVVKLMRTICLVPSVIILSLKSVRYDGGQKVGVSQAIKAFPMFVVGFLVMSLLSSIGLISTGVRVFLGGLGKHLITVVLVAVGLGSDFGRLRTLGFRPFAIGLVTSAVVALSSITLLTQVIRPV